jgi:hypothetical protein
VVDRTPCFSALRLTTALPRGPLGPVCGICVDGRRRGGDGEGSNGTDGRETATKVILFGNFVFLGLRLNSGMRGENDDDSYLYGEGGPGC